MKIHNKSSIEIFIFLCVVVSIVGWLLAYFIYPSKQPNAFTPLEIYLGALILTILVFFFVFTKTSTWSFKITDNDLIFNKIINDVIVNIADIKEASLEITYDYRVPKISEGQIILKTARDTIMLSSIWYPIILKIGEILDKYGIKATYELCEVSTESKGKLECKKFDDWDIFKSEVYKRLGDAIPKEILKD